MRANDWFSNQVGTPKPFLNLNQIGATLGGPIIKDKLFFYVAYEAYRLRAQSIQNFTVLTAPARSGIMTLTDGTGAHLQSPDAPRKTPSTLMWRSYWAPCLCRTTICWETD